MNMNKPTVTVTPDDGSGINLIRFGTYSGHGDCDRNDPRADGTTGNALYHAIERIAELEAERDQLQKLADECYGTIGLLNLEAGELREKNVSLESGLKSLEQTYEALSKDCREYRDESEALAAHVERLFLKWDEMTEKGVTHAKLTDSMDSIFGDAPTASLSKRDARMKAEALESVAQGCNGDILADGLRDIAAEYRQQAEGEDQ